MTDSQEWRPSSDQFGNVSGQRFSTGGSQLWGQFPFLKRGLLKYGVSQRNVYTLHDDTVHNGIQTKLWREEIDYKMLLKVWKCSWSAKTMKKDHQHQWPSLELESHFVHPMIMTGFLWNKFVSLRLHDKERNHVGAEPPPVEKLLL